MAISYQNTRKYGRGITLSNALQPQLIIHIVSHSIYLIINILNYKIMELKELVGKHYLSGFDTATEKAVDS